MMKTATLILAVLLAWVAGNGTQMTQMERISRISEGSAGFQVRSAQPVRLTSGGCCTQPFWSQDGKQVLYIDRPAGGKLGIYGVAVGASGAGAAGPVLISERVDDSRNVGPYRIETASNVTTLVRISDGKKFSIPAQGRTPQFSPDFKRVAWSISNQDAIPEQQVAAIWVANVDGTGAKRIATLRRGSVGGWLSNGSLLVNATDGKNRTLVILSSLSVADGTLTELAQVDRLRSASLSPSGKWIAYYSAFSETGGNGLWIMNTAAGKPKAAPKEAFGAYQWRTVNGADQLVVVPFKPDAQYHEFWQLDPQAMAFRQLTDASTAPLKIANGDWRVSPDGRYVAYVESKDRNIWVVTLP